MLGHWFRRLMPALRIVLGLLAQTNASLARIEARVEDAAPSRRWIGWAQW